MSAKSVKTGILELLQTKAIVKQNVFHATQTSFEQLKNVLQALSVEYNREMSPADTRIQIAFEDKGEFIGQLKVAGDVLVFHMHTNAFEFDREHEVWKSDYVKNDLDNSYCGVINIYNFLHDSFRYHRMNDLGYLIARVFINKEKHYFVEGKRQKGTGINNFGLSEIDDSSLRQIAETAILYSLQFDLLVPPYDDVKIISMMEMSGEIMNSRLPTGKRLGFRYNSDDVKQ